MFKISEAKAHTPTNPFPLDQFGVAGFDRNREGEEIRGRNKGDVS